MRVRRLHQWSSVLILNQLLEALWLPAHERGLNLCRNTAHYNKGLSFHLRFHQDAELEPPPPAVAKHLLVSPKLLPVTAALLEFR